MASGWKYFTGRSPYPEIGKDNGAPRQDNLNIVPCYGPRGDRNYRLQWIQGRRDETKERQLMEWISKCTGDTITPDTDIGEWLRDGQVLCRLMNSLSAGSVKRICTDSKARFGALENIANFHRATEKYGLSKLDSFDANALQEGVDIASVVQSLLLLQGLAISKEKSGNGK